MPLYFLACECGCRFEAVESMAQRHLIPCPDCGKTDLSTDYLAQGQAPRIERSWHGRESRDMSLGVHPRMIGEAMRDVPDAKFDANGDMVFDSDRHQRRVFKQMNEKERRETEREAERQEKALKEAGDRAPDFRTDIPRLG